MALLGSGVSAGTIYANLKLNSSLDKDVKVANSKLGSLGNKMKSLAVPAAAAAGALALVSKASFNLAYDAGNAADRLLDLEQITGLSTVSLQEFTLVTSRAGVEFEQFTAGIGTFERKLPEIMEGTGRSAEMMDRLGVSIYDGAGNLRDMDDILPEVLGAMSGMQNETERNAIAMTLFGRNAEAMLPILALGADGMAQYREEAHELGLVMGEEDLKAANNFRMEVDQLKQQLGAVAREMGVELIPLFRDFVDWLQAAAPHIVDVTKLLVRMGKMILWPFMRFYEGIKKVFSFMFSQVNKAIDVFNKLSVQMDKVGIHMEQLSHIDLSSPIEDLGHATSTTLDEVQTDYAEAQAAMSQPLIPGWAGRGYEFAPDIGMAAPTVYAGKPSPTAAAGGATTGGESAVSMLSSINEGITEGNRLSTQLITAVQNIRMAAGAMGGGFGVDGLSADAGEVRAQSRSEAYRDLAYIVPGRL